MDISGKNIKNIYLGMFTHLEDNVSIIIGCVLYTTTKKTTNLCMSYKWMTPSVSIPPADSSKFLGSQEYVLCTTHNVPDFHGPSPNLHELDIYWNQKY